MRFILGFLLLATNLLAVDPAALQSARQNYAQISHPTEAEREQYILALAKLRARYAESGKTPDWQAVDAEFRRHPAPKDSDAKALSQIMAGKWRSPRHDYLYRADGTWTMLPASDDPTHGTWRIKGNQFFDAASADASSPYTIILLTKKDFLFTDGEIVFFRTRIPK